MMFERIKQMMIKEFHQIFRDKRMRPVIFLTPILQLIIFGYAVTTDVNNIRLAVYDLDRSYESRELTRRFEASGYFQVFRSVERPEEVQDLLDRGKVLAVLQVNRGFSADIKKGKQAEVQVLFDGTDSNTALVAMSYANAIIAGYAKVLGGPHVRASAARFDVRARAWYNPALRSKNYNVPGVIAIMIMLVCLLLTSMAIVREREIGTMEQLMVTPLKPVEMILGKTAPFAIIGFFDMFLVTIVGVLWFSIPIQGSLPLLVLCTAIYLLSVLGIGLFISTISKTQQQAMMGTFLFFAPAILLSGLMFPIENMPAAVQYGTYLNPLRYFLIIIRGIFLKGNGIGILWPQMLALFILGAAVMTISALRFKKRLG
ncbi:MAG TPA: ABC transporter permease [Syntrophorhabdaceae bacterium]|nr:ABC transporter permease [Syntrophorhabdaceae bacterium]HNT69368.1 ABC transporter permease [Syntrophorhabdaceae bacterium]